MPKTQKIAPILAPIAIIAVVCVACLVVLSVRNASAIPMIALPDDTELVYQLASEKVHTGVNSGPKKAPVLVEMFLSQSCSSCVPAAHYVTDLANRKDVVVLSWHVDYWDDLVVGRHGRWKDPYSAKDYTLRQRTYRVNATANGRIYTPQAVINGIYETVGSRTRKVDTFIAMGNPDPTTLNVKRDGDTLTVNVNGASGTEDILLVTFHRNTKTSILGGENAGRNWTEANVVKSVRKLGKAQKNKSQLIAQLSTDDYSKEFGCAVLVQSPGPGVTIGASYCPE